MKKISLLFFLVSCTLPDRPKENQAYPPKMVRVLFDSIEEINQDTVSFCSDDFESRYIFTPGSKICFEGIVYKCEAPGLYRFFNGNSNFQFFCFDVADNNLFEIFSAYCWAITHGSKDNKIWKSWKKQITQREMTLTCGYTTRCLFQLLDTCGYDSRMVQFYAEKNLNGYDDEHVMLETFYDSKKVLLDPDQNAIFLSLQGDTLDCQDFLRLLPKDSVKVLKVSFDNAYNTDDFADYSFSMTGLLTEDGLLRWYKRVCENHKYITF